MKILMIIIGLSTGCDYKVKKNPKRYYEYHIKDSMVTPEKCSHQLRLPRNRCKVGLNCPA